MDYTIKVRPVKTQEDIEQVLAVAKADGSIVNSVPTHVLLKDGHIVGYWSVKHIQQP